MSERAVPFHCPYCAEEDLRPHEVVSPDGTTSSPHGTWECHSCLRAFSLKMIGQLRPSGRPGSAGSTDDAQGGTP